MNKKLIAFTFFLALNVCSSTFVEFQCKTKANPTHNHIECISSTPHWKSIMKPKVYITMSNKMEPNRVDIVDFIQYEYSDDMPSKIGLSFPRMQYLLFRATRIKFIKRTNFACMRQLRMLNLSYNKIRKISHEVFYDLPNLESLDLRFNEIFELPDDLLRNLPKLRYFSADGNKFEKIDPNMFKNNKIIEYVRLQNNRISSVGLQFEYFKELLVVDLRQNAGQCNLLMRIYRNETYTNKLLKRKQFQLYVDRFCIGRSDQVI